MGIAPGSVEDVHEEMGAPSGRPFCHCWECKVERFFSLDPKYSPAGLGALAISWKDIYGYIFPPFYILARVMRKVYSEKCSVLLIAPLWPRHAWFSALKELALESPVCCSRTGGSPSSRSRFSLVGNMNPEELQRKHLSASVISTPQRSRTVCQNILCGLR